MERNRELQLNRVLIWVGVVNLADFSRYHTDYSRLAGLSRTDTLRGAPGALLETDLR